MPASRFEELVDREQFILTVCANGYGKLSSAYEYRRTGRGGQWIPNIANIERNGPVVASFLPMKDANLMLVTNQAKLICMGLDSLRLITIGRAHVRTPVTNAHLVSRLILRQKPNQTLTILSLQ